MVSEISLTTKPYQLSLTDPASLGSDLHKTTMRTCRPFTVTKNVRISKRVPLLSEIYVRLTAVLLLVGAAVSASLAAEPQTTLAISIRTLSSPYQVMYKVGAEAYAKK